MQALAGAFTPANLKDMLRHGVTTAAFCCLIAAALAVSGRGRWASQMVYSLSIGMISWLVIDVGRVLLSGRSKKLWPQGLPGVLLVLAGIAVGFVGGNVIGDAWTGKPLLEFLSFSPDKLASTLVITLAAGVAVCYFYYSRGKARYLEGQIALAERDAVEAKLKLLETQLEPHMLFNTLANLRMLIATDPPRAEAMLDRLNSYLRVTLSGSRALAASAGRRVRPAGRLPGADVGAHGRSLALHARPAGRIARRAGAAAAAAAAGGERHPPWARAEGRRRRDRGARGAPRWRTALDRVRDTGVGIDAAVPPTEGTRFGLAQVRERLAAVHGTLGAIDLIASPAGGACVTVTFPLEKAA